MATSGNFLTSDSGQGGGSYFGRLIFEWWRTAVGLSGSVGYHNISFTLKSYGGASGYWQYTYNNSMNVDGDGYSRGQTQVYGAGATTILSGSKTLYTDSAGNRSFGASAQAGIYTNAVNSSGSGSWAMDNIPINVQITNASGNQNDEFVNPQIWFNNPANYPAYVALDFPDLAFYRIAVRTGMYQASNPYTWTITDAERNAIRSQMANVGSTSMRFIVQNADGVGGQAITRTMTIVNANPVFTTATYKDANSATVAITGNDQYLIQGYSTLEVGIASANKATALKYATMVKYNMAIGSINQDVTYTTSTIAQNLGTLGINANANLIVKAIDSRNYQTSVTLPVNVLPYVAPQVVATVQRVNNFETSTNFHIEGTISRLTIGGTDKNTVNTSTGVRYRYKKTTDGTWGSWVNKTSSTSAGAVSVTDFNVPTALDRNFAWDIQVEITDKLNTSTLNIVLPVGIPIFRIGLDGHVYNNEQPLMPSHVGQIIESTTLTTASAVQAIYGGTWVAWGAGRVVVGLDTGQTEFDTVEETGGAKTHTHTLAGTGHANIAGEGSNLRMERVDGATINQNHLQGGFTSASFSNYNTTLKASLSGSTGSGTTLQPYITAYRYKRTA